jgi:hypothetical protein
MGLIGCPEMSVRNYHYSLCNNPEECSPHLLLRTILSNIFYVFNFAIHSLEDPHYTLSLTEFFTLEDGINRLSPNITKKLPLLAAQ